MSMRKSDICAPHYALQHRPMEFCGLIDSPGYILKELKNCANCEGTSRIGTGLCLKCLLRGALVEEPHSSSPETTLSAILAEVAIADQDRRIGNFEILEEIGRGGMAVIYRARELHSQRIVALKRVLIYHAESDQMLARFRREAETAARLDHPNIIPVYYVGQSEDGLPFFTMKLASGGSLLQAREAFYREPRRSISLLAKVARATQYAHERGVLHRDLKPSNILLDSRWEPMVSDFGLAKWIENSNELTRTLTIFGTAGYIAPERVARPGAPLTVAADIYSLGTILFELLAGRSPFLGEHALAVIQQAAEKPAPSLRSLAPHLDRDLETICARCLEREPSARYHSVSCLADDLQNWLEDRPIIARPVGAPSRLWRWSRRNRMLASTIGTLLLLIAGSVPWGIHSWKLQTSAEETMLARRSVAVFPFLNLDSVAQDDVLAESIGNSLRIELNRFSPARIKTMPSPVSVDLATSEQMQKIARSAKTRTILAGTERIIQGKTRISLRLLDAATGDIRLACARELAVGGAEKTVDEEIGRAFNDTLNAQDSSRLSPSKTDPGLSNPTVREDIMAGRELLLRYSLSDVDKAIDLFKKALRLEPDSSIAHAWLAKAAIGRTHFMSDNSFFTLGEIHAFEAVRLSPDSSDAQRALAGVLYQQGKFAEALEASLRAVESTGSDESSARFISMVLDALGRPDRALRWHSLARQIKGRESDEYGLIGDCWVKLDDDEKAVQAYSRAMELQPDSLQGGVGICHLRLLEGNYEAARELYQTSRWRDADLGEGEQIGAQIEFFARRFDAAEKLYTDLLRRDVNGGGSFYGAVSYQSALGRIKQALGDNTGAKTLLERSLDTELTAVERTPRNPEALYRLAAAESSLGMSQRSIEHLRGAVDSGWIDYRSLAMDPRFDAIRKNLQFRTILKDLDVRIANMRQEAQSINDAAGGNTK
jgi:serine/threonine protein kinase